MHLLDRPAAQGGDRAEEEIPAAARARGVRSRVGDQLANAVGILGGEERRGRAAALPRPPIDSLTPLLPTPALNGNGMRVYPALTQPAIRRAAIDPVAQVGEEASQTVVGTVRHG